MDLPPILDEAKELDELLNLIPPGYRFYPDDVELIEYLKAKIDGNSIILGRIYDVDVYKLCPVTLEDLYMREGEQHMYFFTPRSRKYQNGKRPDRAVVDSGFWKASGKDYEIKHNGTIVGFKKSLVFHFGKPKKADKTNWHMQEFTLNKEIYKQKKSHGSSSVATNKMLLDDWVLCKIYKVIREGGNQNIKEVNEHEVAISIEVVPSSVTQQQYHEAQQEEETPLSTRYVMSQSSQHLNLTLPQLPNMLSLDQNSTDLSSLPPIVDLSWDNDSTNLSKSSLHSNLTLSHLSWPSQHPNLTLPQLPNILSLDQNSIDDILSLPPIVDLSWDSDFTDLSKSSLHSNSTLSPLSWPSQHPNLTLPQLPNMLSLDQNSTDDLPYLPPIVDLSWNNDSIDLSNSSNSTLSPFSRTSSTPLFEDIDFDILRGIMSPDLVLPNDILDDHIDMDHEFEQEELEDDP